MDQALIKVLFVNNGGEGYADWVEVPVGTQVSTFFTKQMGENEPSGNYAKRVRRGAEVFGGRENPIPAEFVLQNGDKVSFTPVKVEGA